MDSDTSLLKGAIAMSTITTILLVVLLAALFNPGLVEQIRNATAAGRAAGAPAIPGLEILLATLGSVAPDIALISGYVGDIVAGGLGKFRYSLTSILAIVAVILNKLIWGLSELPGDYAALSSGAAAFTGASVASAAAGEGGVGEAVRSVISTAAAIPAVGTARSSGGSGDVFAPGRPAIRRRFGEISPLGSSLGLPSAALGPAGPRPTPRGAAGLRTMSGSGDDTTMSGGIFGGGKKVQTGGANEISPEFARQAKPCVIRGLGFLDTQKSPMSIVVLVFIFFIYFLDMAVNLKRTGPEIAGNVFFGLFVLAINIYSFSVFNCYGATTGARVFSVVKAASIGVVFGGIVFAIYNYTEEGKQYLPVDPSPASLETTLINPVLPAKAKKPKPSPEDVGSESQCAGPNADDQFVCDAYKNGKKITTTVVQ
jgi:hypothetical protein